MRRGKGTEKWINGLEKEQSVWRLDNSKFGKIIFEEYSQVITYKVRKRANIRNRYKPK